MKKLRQIQLFIFITLIMIQMTACSSLRPQMEEAGAVSAPQKKIESKKAMKPEKIRHIEKNPENNIFSKTIRRLDSENDDDILIITNAGYGHMNGKSTEAVLDQITEGTGCTRGQQTLLTINTPYYESLWIAVINTVSMKCVFMENAFGRYKCTDLNLAPENILTSEGWSSAEKTDAGNRLYSIVSIAYAAKSGVSWYQLKAAELHGDYCPELIAGFIVQAYMEKNFPIQSGDKYIFVGAPPTCALDALQSINGATPGNSQIFSMKIAEMVNKAIAKNGVKPAITAMRVNEFKTDGVILGFDFSKISELIEVTPKEFNPEGGKTNPLYYISRIKAAQKLAELPMKDKFLCIEEVKSFSGPARLAEQIESGKANPYAPVILSDY